MTKLKDEKHDRNSKQQEESTTLYLRDEDQGEGEL